MAVKIPAGASAFFAYARERHKVYLRRTAGDGRPWSKDRIFHTNRFTNVFRELDKTTAWFRDIVREPLADDKRVVLATVLFRMLNRIEVGEAIFAQGDLLNGTTAFDEFTETGKTGQLKSTITSFVGKRGPYVTGAYIISTPPGQPKLDGVLRIVSDFNKSWQHKQILEMWGNRSHMEAVFELLREVPYLGKFHSYEIVTDLRHTKLLRNAPDVLTWANMGPGARRGLNRVFNRPQPGERRARWNGTIHRDQALVEMRELLKLSRDARLWPQWAKATGKASGDNGGFTSASDWPRWELREVEHTLCEFDKYERVRNGEGKPRGKFTGE